MEKVFSRYYYPIEYFNPHVHLNYNFDNSGLNEAELKALLHEEYKNKCEKIKEVKNKEYVNKYNKSAQLFEEEQRMKNREEELKRKKLQNEQLLKKQNYNKSVYNKNMKNYLKEKELKEKEKEKAKTINKLKKSKSLNKQEKKTNKLKSQNLDTNSNKYIIFDKNIQKEINEGFVDNLDKSKNENINLKDKDTYIDNNVVDLRYELENQLLEEIKNKNRTINNSELKDEVNDKLNTIKKFRNFGCLPGHSPENIEKIKNKESKNKKFSSEFERRRFIKSMKNAINERLGQQNIEIQNICNCGNLYKKLDTLIENGNLNITEIDCENNCIFYKNQKEYLQKLNEVLESVKELASNNKIKKDK